MANVYMRIDGLTSIKGAATLEEIGGQKGFMPIDEVSLGVARPIVVSVGASTAAEVGTSSFQDVTVKRGCDGASPYLQTFFFAPGDNGRKLEIVVTKAARTGEGLIPSMTYTLEEARLASYGNTAADASPGEKMTIAYTKISITHYIEDADGKISKGDTVAFDLKTAKLVSKAKL